MLLATSSNPAGLASCALGDSKLALLLGSIRLLLFAPIVKFFADLKRGIKLPEDEWICLISFWTLHQVVITGFQIHLLLKAYEWDVSFVFLKLVTTFEHNDAVRTLAMDVIFGRVWVEKYAGLEMAKVEGRLLKEIGEQRGKDEVKPDGGEEVGQMVEEREKAEVVDADQLSGVGEKSDEREVDQISEESEWVQTDGESLDEDDRE